MFDLNKTPVYRFFYPKTEKKEWFDLRSIPTRVAVEKRKEIFGDQKYDKHEVKMRGKVQSVFPIPIPEDDPDKIKTMDDFIIDYTIHGWHLVGPDGEDIESTKENKILLLNNYQEVRDWYNERYAELGKGERILREAEEKN